MRRIASASARTPSEHDEMMSAEAKSQHRLNFSAQQPSQSEFPKHAPVAAAHANDPDYAGKDRQALQNITWRESLTACGPRQAVGPHRFHLMLIARKQSFGPVGLLHARAPHGENLRVGQPKLDIRLAGCIFFQQPVFALKPVPKRSAR